MLLSNLTVEVQDDNLAKYCLERHAGRLMQLRLDSYLHKYKKCLVEHSDMV
jgi:hypothetical protein